MSMFADRSATALLVIDVQNGVVAGAYRRDDVVATIAALVDRARASGTPVVWVQHNEDGELETGADLWQIVPELAPAEGEPVIQKRYGDSFEETDLEEVLAGLGAGSLVVTGAETDACIRSTIHGAVVRGYDALLVGDAHTLTDKSSWGSPPPADVVAYTNLYWRHHSAPGRSAGVAEAAEVTFVPTG